MIQYICGLENTLTLTDLIAVLPDALMVLGALIFALRSFSYARSIRSGFYARNFTIVGISALFLVLAELGHLAADAGIYPIGELLHDIIEAAFVIILAIGISKFNPSWMPKSS